MLNITDNQADAIVTAEKSSPIATAWYAIIEHVEDLNDAYVAGYISECGRYSDYIIARG